VRAIVGLRRWRRPPVSRASFYTSLPPRPACEPPLLWRLRRPPVSPVRVRASADARAWTRDFHARRTATVGPPNLVATFGCFSYADLDGECLRLHFHDAETDGASPLAKDRQDARRAELAALFAHVRRTRHGPRRVIGRSWLYNLEAYRRLFPAPYLATAHPLANSFRYMPLWGQFATRAGGIREAAAQELRERLARWSAGGNLAACFPLQALAVEASVTEFYRFHRFALI